MPANPNHLLCFATTLRGHYGVPEKVKVFRWLCSLARYEEQLHHTAGAGSLGYASSFRCTADAAILHLPSASEYVAALKR